jgi:hypothetical protein
MKTVLLLLVAIALFNYRVESQFVHVKIYNNDACTGIFHDGFYALDKCIPTGGSSFQQLKRVSDTIVNALTCSDSACLNCSTRVITIGSCYEQGIPEYISNYEFVAGTNGYVTQYFTTTGCAAANLAVSISESNSGCYSTGDDSYESFTCSGSTLNLKTCNDSTCANCDIENIPINTCLTTTQYQCGIARVSNAISLYINIVLAIILAILSL